MTSHTAVLGGASAAANAFGDLLRRWRAQRSLSQLALALDAQISQRHISFIESGRATPSRDMIARIGDAMDLPLRARNDLLLAAGFAPSYPERDLDDGEMRGVRQVLKQLLAHHEPYPAMVVDRSWNVVMKNDANRRIVAACLEGRDPAAVVPGEPVNFLRLMFAENGLRPRVRNWSEAAPALLSRVRREARAQPGSPSDALYRELAPAVRSLGNIGRNRDALTPTIPLELEVRPGVVLRVTNTLTTFGTPQDVGVQELRIEMSFPLDDASDQLLREWARR
jgi:transcriptional regulator with XRE-family HTH domain